MSNGLGTAQLAGGDAAQPRMINQIGAASEIRDRLENSVHRLDQMLVRLRGAVPEEAATSAEKINPQGHHAQFDYQLEEISKYTGRFQQALAELESYI